MMFKANQRPIAIVLGLIGILGFSCGVTATSGDELPVVSGTVEGIVTYAADPVRPWRLGRYYLKDKKSGALAEAVVVLDRKPVSESRRIPQVAVVDQKNFQFTPETVVIRSGDSVKFLNNDEASHNVMASHLRQAFNITLSFGEEHIEKFHFATGIRQPYVVGCVFHSAMRNWIFVFDHPSYQLTGTDGRFRLENVPAGTYRLDMFHPAGELRTSQMVIVEAGKTTMVEIHVTPDDIVRKKQ